MRADLMAELGACCSLLGIGLQYLRSFVRMTTGWVVGLGVIVALCLWALGFDWKAAADVQAAIVHSIPIVGTFVSALLGGLFGTERAANSAVAKGADPEHPLVPVTK